MESVPSRDPCPYIQALGRRVLVFDGAMGTCIQDCSPTTLDFGGRDGCNESLNVFRPALIEQIHTAFLEAGCDAIETNTFGASRLKLNEYGLGERTFEVNLAAAQLARRTAERFGTPERPRFVAGAIGPTGMLPSTDDPSLGGIGFDALVDVFCEQAQALIEGGVDLLVIETAQDLLELKAAIAGARRAFSAAGRAVPIQAQVTLLERSSTMLLGTDLGAALATLEALPVDVIGLNCSTGPEMMREPVRFLTETSTRPIAVVPNAGLPINEGGRAVYPMSPAAMAEILAEFVDRYGVNIVGGCCGSTPDHIRLLAEHVRGRPPGIRPAGRAPAVASAIHAVALRQIPAPLIVGERVNATGSRAVKRLLLADDYDGILQIAREQVQGGAHVLDVSVAVTERPDELEQMCALVRKLQMGVEAPLIIDSTEPDVQIAALKQYPGRAVVNSVNLENRAHRLDRVMPSVLEHGAAVVGQTIDERGMAKTAPEKEQVAARLVQILNGEYGLPSDAIIIDTLVFPIVTGDPEFARAAVETIDGIRRIKATLPGVLTILGVSNLSFGISAPARAVLNSVFLYHAVAAGLDLAIVNPAQITPYAEIPPAERALADDLIFDRRPDALARFIQHFEQRGGRGSTPAGPAHDDTASLSVEERIHRQILHRQKDGIEALLNQAIATHDPVWVLNHVLLPAMKDVGDRFGAGELILPFVLQSAEVMKRAVAHLERFLEKSGGHTKGTVIIATVFGDVHDIGKNLAGTILANNGYTVHDLGKQVPLNRIIDAAVETGADAIGLSALLVSTSKQMPLCVQELHRRGLAIPVLIGGAAINRAFGRRALFVKDNAMDDGVPYAGGVFYAKDAFEGLGLVDTLTDPERRDGLRRRIVEEARAEAGRLSGHDAALTNAGSRRSPSLKSDVPLPAPPFWGVRTVDAVALDDIFSCMDRNTLFRLHWGGKVHGDAYERLLEEEFSPRLERMQQEAATRGYLRPRAVYGYFPANSDGNDLIFYDPHDHGREIVRFTFPRQPSRDRLCLADYFLALEPGPTARRDVAVLQLVTMGEPPTRLVDSLQAAGAYADAYFWHGLAVEAAEGLAEYMQRQIQRELGLPAGRGKRYSWGYPACPDLEQHGIVTRLLDAEAAIGVRLTAGFQFAPEQSTAALFVHHPQAKYYSTSVSRETETADTISVPV